MDHKDLTIQELRARNKKITEELKQLKKQRAAVDMDKLTTEMMEHICDNLCKHPNRVGITQDESEDICDNCKMGKFVCDILNTYNHQARQLAELKEESLDPVEMCEVKILIDEFLEYKRLQEQGLLLKLPCEFDTDVFVIPTKENSFNQIACMKFLGIQWDTLGAVMNLFSNNRFDKKVPKMYQPSISAIRKTIFLTEQEAQSALEKMKGE